MKKEIKELIEFSKILTVLYVEDNKEARESTLLMLNNLFDNIVIATDGFNGLEKLKTHKFDLIITDINMPNLNGIEMCEQIKKLYEDIPIVITSAHTESNYLLDAIRLGADGYILKPIDFNQLMNVFYKVIKNIKNNIEFKKNMKIKQKYEKIEAINNMVNNIAHHWRQPLTVINLEAGNIKLANECNFSTEESNISSSKTIINSVEVLNNTIKDFEKLFNRNHKNDTTEINLKDTIEKLISDSKDIEIIKQISDISIVTNKDLIKDVFMAIYNNAKEAIESNNSSKKLIFLDIYTNNDDLYITIKDNGLGIDANIINEIFEPYITSKHKDFGTGLSLYHVHNIITKYLNGTIEVSNDTYEYNNIKYKGAKFEIILKI